MTDPTIRWINVLVFNIFKIIMYYRMLTNHYAISLKTEIVNRYLDRYTKCKSDMSLTKMRIF